MSAAPEKATAASEAGSQDFQEWMSWAEERVCDVYPKLQAFIIGRLGWQVGEDVVQETMIGIIKGLSRIRGRSEGEFLGFCFRIAGNKINDALRSKYASRIQPLDPEIIAEIVEAGSEQGLSPDDRAQLNELIAIIQKAKFPCDRVLYDVLLLGLGTKEIAAGYAISYDGARMKIGRCLEAVQVLVKQGGW